MTIGRPRWMLDPSQPPPRFIPNEEYPIPWHLKLPNPTPQPDGILYGIAVEINEPLLSALNETQLRLISIILSQFVIDTMLDWLYDIETFYAICGQPPQNEMERLAINIYEHSIERLLDQLEWYDIQSDKILSAGPGTPIPEPNLRGDDSILPILGSPLQSVTEVRAVVEFVRYLTSTFGRSNASQYCQEQASKLSQGNWGPNFLGAAFDRLLGIETENQAETNIISNLRGDFQGILFLKAWDTTDSIEKWEQARREAKNFLEILWQTIIEHPWFYYNEEIEH